jgi:hypothetical protein
VSTSSPHKQAHGDNNLFGAYLLLNRSVELFLAFNLPRPTGAATPKIIRDAAFDPPITMSAGRPSAESSWGISMTRGRSRSDGFLVYPCITGDNASPGCCSAAIDPN